MVTCYVCSLQKKKKKLSRNSGDMKEILAGLSQDQDCDPIGHCGEQHLGATHKPSNDFSSDSENTPYSVNSPLASSGSTIPIGSPVTLSLETYAQSPLNAKVVTIVPSNELPIDSHPAGLLRKLDRLQGHLNHAQDDADCSEYRHEPKRPELQRVPPVP